METNEATYKRFKSKIETDKNGCWRWQGSKNTRGYGNFSAGGRTRRAHRWSYDYHVKPIPEGMVIDHLCRVPGCVNPDHLEAVTSRENTLRGNHPNAIAHRENRCRVGHSLDEENSYISRKGRSCKLCRHARYQQSKEPK